jgi:hypothetical protein
MPAEYPQGRCRHHGGAASSTAAVGVLCRVRSLECGPERRGTWTTEAWTAGACSLLGDWAAARRAWANCLTELAYFDADLAPETRRLAAHGVDADDSQRRSALVARLLENEQEMRVRWHLP